MTNAARLADNLNVDFIVIASFPWPAHLWSYVPARVRFLLKLAEQRNFSACFFACGGSLALALRQYLSSALNQRFRRGVGIGQKLFHLLTRNG